MKRKFQSSFPHEDVAQDALELSGVGMEKLLLGIHENILPSCQTLSEAIDCLDVFGTYDIIMGLRPYTAAVSRSIVLHLYIRRSSN